MQLLDKQNWINTDKQNLEKKIGDVDKKTPGISFLVTTNVLKTKIGEVEKKNTRYKWFSDYYCS